MQPLLLGVRDDILQPFHAAPLGIQTAQATVNLETLLSDLQLHEATLEEQQTDGARKIVQALDRCTSHQIAEIVIRLYSQSAWTPKLQTFLMNHLDHKLISVAGAGSTRFFHLSSEQLVTLTKAFLPALPAHWNIADALEKALLPDSFGGTSKIDAIGAEDLILTIDALLSCDLIDHQDFYTATYISLLKSTSDGQCRLLHMPPEHALVIISQIGMKNSAHATTLFKIFENQYLKSTEVPIQNKIPLNTIASIHLGIIVLLMEKTSIEHPALLAALFDELLRSVSGDHCKLQDLYPFLAIRIIAYGLTKIRLPEKAITLLESEFLRNKETGKFELSHFNALELATIITIFRTFGIKNNELFIAIQEAFLAHNSRSISFLEEHYKDTTTEKTWLAETLYFFAKNTVALPQFFTFAETLFGADYGALETETSVFLVQLAVAFSWQKQGKKELFTFIEKKIVAQEAQAGSEPPLSPFLVAELITGLTMRGSISKKLLDLLQKKLIGAEGQLNNEEWLATLPLEALGALVSFFAQRTPISEALFRTFEKELLKPADREKTKLQKLAETNWSVLPEIAMVYEILGVASAGFIAALDTALLLKGQTAYLTIATSHKSADLRAQMLNRLIDKGLDVRTPFTSKSTALHIATEQGLIEVVKKLVQKRVDLNRYDASGETALHLSCRLGLIQITELLLASNADIAKVTQKTKKSPFQLALSSPLWLIEPSKMMAFFIHFFGNFKPIIELLNLGENESVLTNCLLTPEILFPQDIASTQHVNPFEFVFLFQHVPLAAQVAGQMLESDQMAYLDKLLAKYPQHPTVIIAGMFLLACKNRRPNFALSIIDKCKELNYSYPQRETFLHLATRTQMTQVVKRLCEKHVALNRADEKGDTALHNACYYGFGDQAGLLLAHGADPTVENVAQQTAFKSALSSSLWRTHEAQMKQFFCRIFNAFGAIKERITSHGKQDFLSYFTMHAELLCDARKNEAHANPLEVAYLLQDAQLARALYIKMGEDAFQTAFAELKTMHPQATLDLVACAGFDLNPVHLAQETRVAIPEKPDGAVIDGLLTLFDEVAANFNPLDFSLDASKIKLRKQLEDDFVLTVKNKKVYTGAPTEFIRPGVRNPALDAFYKNIDNAFCHSIVALQRAEKNATTTQRKVQFLVSCLKAPPCGGALQKVAIEQYDLIVRDKPPTFKKAFYEALGDMRVMILQSLTPSGEQNVHLYNQAFFLLAQELNLPYKETAFDDRNGRVDGMPKEATKHKFFEKLTPAAIISFIELKLAQDGDFREKFMDFCKENMPDTWQKEHFAAIKTEVAALQAKGAPKEAVTEFLKRFDITIQGEVTAEALEAVRKSDYFEAEIVEDATVIPMRFKRQAITAELIRLQAIMPVVCEAQTTENLIF